MYDLTFRDKILKYKATVNTVPLIFVNEDFEEERGVFVPKGTVLEMVQDCLELMGEFYSMNSYTKQIETRPNRNRSSWDIWRHIIYICPEITIFQVMAALFENREGNMESLNCCDIERRVFRYRINGPDCVMNGESDEFDKKFSQWKYIDPSWTE